MTLPNRISQYDMIQYRNSLVVDLAVKKPCEVTLIAQPMSPLIADH